MTYQVSYTDTSNPNKVPIRVADGTINSTSTSLKFVGQSYPKYSEAIAEDFLHLLENFASPFAPGTDTNNPMGPPLQGQLWYDTSTSILKVYDGTNWSTAGNLKKSSSAPAVASSVAGDLWSNIATNQLYFFTGSNWVLIGPQFSAGTQTGPIVEEIIDTSNIAHSVISMYANNSRISIISKEKFIPKATILGFATVNQGITLSTVDATSTVSPIRFHGTAISADGLLVNGSVINASNFLTTDGTTNITNYPFNIRVDTGISIGSNLGLNIGVTNNTPTITYGGSGSNLNIRLTNSSGVLTTVIHADPSGKVGIGVDKIDPATALDVAGTITASTGLNILGTADASYSTGTLFTTAAGSIVSQGGLVVAKKAIIGNNLTVYGQSFFNYYDNTSTPIAAPVLVPGYSTNAVEATNLSIPYVATGVYDIGSLTRPFRNIYASSFAGNFSGVFSGILEGSVSGSAALLASPTIFSIAGDLTSNSVSFNGQSETGTAVFNATISSNVISSKIAATDSFVDDQLLVFRAGSGLLKMAKSVFTQHIAVVPISTILPFAGTTLPTGYLFCDGSEVLISAYPDLFSVIGFTYKNTVYLLGAGTFALPDLRGRFPLGADNMINDNNTVPSRTGGTQINTVTDLNGNSSTSAHRVNEVTASVVGSGNASATGSVALTSANLPDHTHTLKSAAGVSYYAGSSPGSASDSASGATAGYGLSGSSTGSGIPNTGTVNGATGSGINVMNPYQTINYIIFTGKI